jgi:hypothetical protein
MLGLAEKEGAMTLTPSDILEIQSAIDEYEKRFPRKPSPSVAEALAWRLGKKQAAMRAAVQSHPDPASSGMGAESSQHEGTRRVRTEGKTRLRVWHTHKHSAGLQLWGKRTLRFCGWGWVAMLSALFFLFGAFVGGFKWAP